MTQLEFTLWFFLGAILGIVFGTIVFGVLVPRALKKLFPKKFWWM